MGSIEISNEKSREQRTLFDEFRSHYFCTVLYITSRLPHHIAHLKLTLFSRSLCDEF